MQILLLFLILTGSALEGATAQGVKLLTSGRKVSMRGLSVVTDKVIWVSGSNGTVGLSKDSGNTWKWITIKGFEKTDFRDVEAFDDKTAVVMGIDSPSYILRTTDGGESWTTVFENHRSGMFLDAMEFWNEMSGTAIGDPINGKFVIIRTFDGGKTWQGIPEKYLPSAGNGEACFASSGTNVRKLNKSESVFVSGGMEANLFIRYEKIKIPVIQGTATTGANSIAVKNRKTFMVVGGDFNTKDSTLQNCAFSDNGGRSWSTPIVPPHGYRSCVEYLGKSMWITCGLNGVDLTTDNGKNFSWISKDSYHVCRKAKKGKAVFFAGGGGRIGKLVE